MRLSPALLALLLLACSNPAPSPTPSPEPDPEPTPVTDDAPALKEMPANAPARPNPDTEGTPVVIARVDGDAFSGGAARRTFDGHELALAAARHKSEVSVTATYGGGTHALGSCDATKPLLVEAKLDAPHVHVLCLKLSPEGKPMWTNGSRFMWNATDKKFVAAGGYEGEGRVDPDTIDLDEE